MFLYEDEVDLEMFICASCEEETSEVEACENIIDGEGDVCHECSVEQEMNCMNELNNNFKEDK